MTTNSIFYAELNLAPQFTFLFVQGLFFSFLVFLGLHPWHMEFPRLGVESEL